MFCNLEIVFDCVYSQAMEHLQSFINECDRKTELYKRRLKETQEELSEEANSKVAYATFKLNF